MVVLSFFSLCVLLLAFILASVEDIKKREVYDYLNYFLTFFFILLAIVHSLLIESFEPLRYVLFGLLLGFAFGSLLYYLGVWGGGDAKFLIGFGASMYYIIDFFQDSFLFSQTTGYIYESFASLYALSIDYFLAYLIVLDLIVITFMFFMFFFVSMRSFEKKELFFAFLLLVTLFYGLMLGAGTFWFFLLGFVSFLLIFFIPEGSFEALYFSYKKQTKHLQEGDKIINDVVFDKHKTFKGKKLRAGIERNELFELKKHFDSNVDFDVKFLFPFSSLVVLNFSYYVFKLVSFSEFSLSLLLFLLVFLFVSFVIGGVLSLVLLAFYFVKNFSKIGFALASYEKWGLLFGFGVILLLSLLHKNFIILLGLFVVYFFVKIAKQVESFMFVAPKKISDIVPGDWIVEDIVVAKKTYFKVEDFKLGINEVQLEKLLALAKKHKAFTHVKVKDGIPFLPPLALGFLLLFFLL